MTKCLLAAASAFFLVTVSLPSTSATPEIPAERNFPSAVGEVTFRHQMHTRDLAIKCVQCHHQIDAKALKTPHPDYFKSSWINCGTCHRESEKAAHKAYVCSGCHTAKPSTIADETLSAKVVIHNQCWKCHPTGSGAEASKSCEKCHSGKKTL